AADCLPPPLAVLERPVAQVRQALQGPVMRPARQQVKLPRQCSAAARAQLATRLAEAVAAHQPLAAAATAESQFASAPGLGTASPRGPRRTARRTRLGTHPPGSP